MANNIYGFIALTGGGTGALDAIDGTSLANLDMAEGIVSGFKYSYALNASLGLPESSPNIIIPDTGAGAKGWVLISCTNQNLRTTDGPTFAHTHLTDALTDNDSSTLAASTAFVKGQIANDTNPKAMAQGVVLQAAAIAAIKVLHSAVYSNTTNSFDIGGEFALPTWTPAATQVLINKWAANVGYKLEVLVTSGIFRLTLNATTYDSAVPGGGAASNLVADTAHKILVTPTVGALTTTVTFSLDGVLLSTTAAQANVDVTNTQDLYIGGTSAAMYAMTVYEVYDINRAYSASDVLNHYRNGLAESDKWGSQVPRQSDTAWTGASGATPPTNWIVAAAGLWDIDSGALKMSVDTTPTTNPTIYRNYTAKIGTRYTVSYSVKKGTAASVGVFIGSTTAGMDYLSATHTDADFTTYTTTITAITTVISITLITFSAVAGETGYIDTVEIYQLGATLALEHESWQSDKPYDCSSNNLTCVYPATGWSLTRPNNIGLPVLTNLLGNSGFSIWSNETVCEVISGAAPVTDGANAALVNNLLTNGGFDSVTTGWTAQLSATLESDATGKTGNGLKITNNGSSYGGAYQAFTTVVGKLYYASVYFQKGTAAHSWFDIGTTSGSGDVYRSTAFTDVTFGQHTVVFKATVTTTYITLTNNDNSGGTGYFDSVVVYEVTPGCVAANTLGPDGWQKSTGIDIWRQHTDATYTKNGSFYSLKTTTAAADQVVYWPISESSSLKKIAGRPMTMGAWVYATDASHAAVRLYDGTIHLSSYHSGVAGWEWLEVTATISSSVSVFNAAFVGALNAKTAYFSQPMLVYGSKIGPGNYQPIPQEVINLAAIVYPTGLANGAPASGATSYNLEATSSGKLGKGVTGLWIDLEGKNTAAAKYIAFGGLVAGEMGLYSQVANQLIRGQSRIACAATGDFVGAAEDANWSAVYLGITAVQL